MADSAKSLHDRELRDTISELKTVIKNLNDTINSLNQRIEELSQKLDASSAQIDKITEERDNLKAQVQYLSKKLFGTSSEKGKCHDIEGQINLFNEAEAEQDSAVLEDELQEMTEETVTKKRKPRKTNAERFKDLPTEKVYLDPPEEDLVCPQCGTPLEKIGEEFVRREYVIIPPKVIVREYYSNNYGCPYCKEHAEKPYIVKGKNGKPHMIHGMASASTVAWIIFQKFFSGMPLYRQEAQWKQCGADIGRATLANWIIRNSDEFLRPMYDFFHRKLVLRGFIMADETTTQVLHEPGRRAQSTSYMWLFRTGEDGGPPIIIYKYSETRAGDTAVNFLQGFNGYYMCDGYSGYNKLPKEKRTVCWAHIRRYLLDAVPKGKEKDYSEPSVQGALYVNRLFDIEKDIQKKHHLDFDAIKEARIAKEKPVIEAFLAWLEKQNPVKGSRMDKAVVYVRNRIPYLMTYLEDGRCSFSNNLSENSIRPFVLGRKGWLFSDQPVGAEASAICYTIVEMAKANGINVKHYLTYLFEKLPNKDMTDEELEKLAPWNEEVKAEVARMAAED